jgi:hypothetical protein
MAATHIQNVGTQQRRSAIAGARGTVAETQTTCGAARTRQRPCHRTMHRTTALGSAALLVGPSGAQAGAGGFAVSGSASGKDQKIVQGAATYAAGETGWVMMKAPLDEAALKKVQTCVKAGDNPWPCIEPTASKVGFDRLILLQADADKANPGTIVITTQVVAAQVGGARDRIRQRSFNTAADNNL